MTIVLNGQPEGVVYFQDTDMLLVEVSKEDQALRMLWHHPDTGENVLFYGNMGIYEKKGYEEFMKIYQKIGTI